MNLGQIFLLISGGKKKKKEVKSYIAILSGEREMILSCFYKVQFSPLPQEHHSL